MVNNKVEIICAEYDEGDVFVLKIERIALVHALRNTIYDNQRCKERYLFDASELTLYMARAKNGEWLKDDRELGNLLRRSVSVDYNKMQPEWTLEECFGNAFTPGCVDIHILIQFPAKRRRISRDLDLRELLAYFDWELTTFPASSQLSTLLQRPLSFKLANVWESYEVSDIFRPDSPVVACDELMVMVKSFLYMCNAPPPDLLTKHSWIKYYEALLRIPLDMCRAKSIYLHERRHDASKRTASKRTDWLLLYKTFVLMRAEEHSEDSHLYEAVRDLMTKTSR